MIRVFIVAPSVAVRAGLKSLLMEDQGIQVTGEVAHMADLSEETSEADVLLWSPGLLPTQRAVEIEISKYQVEKTAPLLIIYDDPSLIEKLLQRKVQVWGLLPAESTQAEILAAVNALSEGLAVTSPAWMQYLTTSLPKNNDESDDLAEPLTGRELEILQLLALGLTNKQIALRLGISAHTVKFHVSSIFSKMRTTNRTETVKLGLRKGLILL